MKIKLKAQTTAKRAEQKANRAKWIEALRSGKYKQTDGALQQDGKFCCLGVACEVAILNGVKVKRKETKDEYYFGGVSTTVSYDGQSGTLPKKVQKWLGMTDESGTFNTPAGDPNDLTMLNDEAKWSFKKIAKFVESEPEGMFKS